MNGSHFRAVYLLAAVVLAGCAVRPVEQGTKAPSVAVPAQEAQTSAVEPAAPALPVNAPPIYPEAMNKILVAEIGLQRGQYDVAIKNYLELGETYRDARLLERAARIAVYAHDDEHALAAAKLWVELEPKNVDAREVVTAFYIRNGQYDEAQQQLEALLAINGDGNENAFMVVAGLLGRQQDKQAALEVMQRLVNTRPNDANALLALSNLALRAGVLDQAEQAIKRVTELKPDRMDVLIQQARILMMRGKGAEATGLLEKAVKNHPKDTALRAAYARLLVDAKQMDKAFAQFKLVNKQDPDEPDILLALGIVAVELSHVDDGEKYFLRLIELNRNFQSESSYYLGRIAEEFRKDPDAAIKWYSKVEQSQRYLEAQIRIAFLLAKKGDVDRARGQLSAISPQDPGQVLRIYLADGQILRDAGRPQEAIDVFTAALDELPDNTDILYARAMTAERMGQIDATEKDLRQILVREPDHFDALNALGYVLADRTGRYDEALTYIKRALDLRPDSYYVLDSMGWVQYRLGHNQEAVTYLRRALDLSPESEIAAHLAEVLWVMGDKQAARAVWDKALQGAPGNKLLLDTVNRLDHK